MMQVYKAPVAKRPSPDVGSGERESARLEALERFDVLDTPKEEAFDRITRLTKKLFKVPIATVSFLDGHRQWFKSCQGLTGSEAPREHTFCNRTINEGQPVVVTDATTDPRFAQNPFVLGEPFVRAYLGVPLQTSDGHMIGTLCVVDMEPRAFDSDQVEILSDLARMAMEELELRLLATRDSLTGALSRRAFKEEAQRATALTLRHHHELSCIAFDLDHFKSVNDTYGHAAGDAVLLRTVQACTGQLRTTDLIGRLGGEEFAVLLPATPLTGAMDVAEKLRSATERLAIHLGPQEISITASFGVASLDPATRDAEVLLKNADAALYQAKAAGRNRCFAWRSPDGELRRQRRRVLKGGQIIFNGGTSSIDCTVRSLSDESAGLDVFSSVGVPRRFDLAIRSDSFQKPCRVIVQAEKHIEVAFG